MFDPDAKTIQRMAPMLQRVLIVDPQAAGARLIAELMRSIARCQVLTAATLDKGLKLAETCQPSVVFVELSDKGVDGVEFTKKLRRSHLQARHAPVIMVASQATAAGILAARDAGVHEFLRKPFTLKDLLRRLEAVTLRQRDWVEAVGYVGPDRRRFNSGEYSGPLKRRSDVPPTPDSVRTAQALKILRSAIAAIGTDPEQALRSMQAQAADLKKAAASAADMRLTAACIEFDRYLGAVAKAGGTFDGAELERRVAPLLAYMPKDAEVYAA